MNSRENKSFCILPWVHAHVDTSGSRRLCCNDNLSHRFMNVPLDDFWNSDFIREIRQKMIKGEMVEACSGCINNISNEKKSPRDIANDIFYEKNKQKVSQTTEEGCLNIGPVSFDYRFGNICNLACITCSPNFSSKIEKEYQEINQPSFIVKHISLEQAKDEIIQSIDKKELQSLYWAGGEPLFSKYHWEITEYIKIKNYIPFMENIIYNTNLSIPTNKVLELAGFLKQIKNYRLYLSLDGLDRVGEFLRDGLDWKLWRENLELLPQSKVVIDITVTTPALLYLHELAQFTIKNKYYVNLRSISLVDAKVILSPLALPRHNMKKIIAEIKGSIFKEFGLSPFSLEYISYLKRLESSLSMKEKFGLLPNIYMDTEKSKLEILAANKIKKNNNHLTYHNVLKQNQDVLNWWNRKFGVLVIDSELKEFEGEWNQTKNVHIAHLSASFFSSNRSNYKNLEFTRFSFIHTSIKKSKFEDCRFIDGSSKNCTIENCTFTNCSFLNCKIEDITLKNQSFQDLHFKNRALTDADFTNH